jgi:cytidylate kinase
LTVIAIDGPSGSGKSTVAKELARRLGLAYLDTGAMYRAAALAAAVRGALGDPDAMVRVVEDMALEISLDPDAPRVAVLGKDVTEAIRSEAVTRSVSKVSTVIPVREVLVRRQRLMVLANRQPGIVVEGRDITTVVAPDADVRVLITARPQVRLARRALERVGSDSQAARARTEDEVLRRDKDDSAVAQFLAPAEGVAVVDSSDLDAGQTVEAVLALVGAL